MANYVTLVIKYEDDAEQPVFGPNMQTLGGTVSAVQFNDALAEMEDMSDCITELQEKIDEVG